MNDLSCAIRALLASKYGHGFAGLLIAVAAIEFYGSVLKKPDDIQITPDPAACESVTAASACDRYAAAPVLAPCSCDEPKPKAAGCWLPPQREERCEPHEPIQPPCEPLHELPRTPKGPKRKAR